MAESREVETSVDETSADETPSVSSRRWLRPPDAPYSQEIGAGEMTLEDLVGSYYEVENELGGRFRLAIRSRWVLLRLFTQRIRSLPGSRCFCRIQFAGDSHPYLLWVFEDSLWPIPLKGDWSGVNLDRLAVDLEDSLFSIREEIERLSLDDTIADARDILVLGG